MRYGVELCLTNYLHSKHLHLPHNLDMCICLHTHTHTHACTRAHARTIINPVIWNVMCHHQNSLELMLHFCCCIHINFWYFALISDSSNFKFISQVCLVTGWYDVQQTGDCAAECHSKFNCTFTF